MPHQRRQYASAASMDTIGWTGIRVPVRAMDEVPSRCRSRTRDAPTQNMRDATPRGSRDGLLECVVAAARRAPAPGDSHRVAPSVSALATSIPSRTPRWQSAHHPARRSRAMRASVVESPSRRMMLPAGADRSVMRWRSPRSTTSRRLRRHRPRPPGIEESHHQVVGDTQRLLDDHRCTEVCAQRRDRASSPLNAVFPDTWSASCRGFSAAPGHRLAACEEGGGIPRFRRRG